MKTSGQGHQRGLAMAGLVFAVLFWAVNAVVAKGVTDHIPPMALSFYRWAAALIFLFPFAYKGVRHEKKVIREHLWILFWLSLPSVAIYNSFLYLAALYTTATNISLVVAAMPAMTLAAAWFITKDRPRPVQVTGISLALLGVITIVAKGAPSTIYHLDLNPGDLLMVGSIGSWAVYSIYYKKLALPISPIPFLFMTMVLGTLLILPFYLWDLSIPGGFEVTRSMVVVFIYLGICPSVLSYIFWNHGVKELGASTASIFVYLILVFASAIAYFYLGEQLFFYHVLGGVFILAGLIFSSWEFG